MTVVVKGVDSTFGRPREDGMPGHQYIEKPIRKHTRQMVFTIIDRTFQTVRILAVNMRSFNLLSSAMSKKRISWQHVEASYRSAFRELVVLPVRENRPRHAKPPQGSRSVDRKKFRREESTLRVARREVGSHFCRIADKPGPHCSGTLYAPAESLWLLDCAIPYCRILYNSAL